MKNAYKKTTNFPCFMLFLYIRRESRIMDYRNKKRGLRKQEKRAVSKKTIGIWF